MFFTEAVPRQYFVPVFIFEKFPAEILKIDSLHGINDTKTVFQGFEAFSCP